MLPGIYWPHKVFSRHSEGCPFQCLQTICLEEEIVRNMTRLLTLSAPDVLYRHQTIKQLTDNTANLQQGRIHFHWMASEVGGEAHYPRFNEAFILMTRIKWINARKLHGTGEAVMDKEVI